jgi:carbon monoxide dehydrogenase subunit G
MELKNEFEVRTGVEEAWRVLTDVERIAPCLPGAELREIDGDEYRGVVKVKVGPITAEYRGAARFVELDAGEHRAVLRAEGREARGQGNAAATITAVLEASDNGTKVSVTTDLSITGKVAQFGRGVLADVSGKLLGQFVENLEATVIEHGDEESGTSAGSEPADESHAKGARSPRRGGSRPQRSAAAPPAEEAPAAEEHETRDVSSNGAAAPEPEAVAEEAGTSATEEAEPAAEKEHEHEGATVRRLEPRPAEPVDLMEVAGPSLLKRLGPIVAAVAVIAVVVAVLRRRG